MINLDELRYNEQGLIPCIVQDYKDNEVLMMAYMNKESLEMSLEKGEAIYYSRSRQKLWHKGETSGNFQKIKTIYYDCDSDTLLIKIEQIGGVACHTGKRSCFHNILKEFEKIENSNDIINDLYELISDRKDNPVEGSYTNYLFDKGIDKILKKVGEENAEVIIGAKNSDKSEVIYETADLTYHILVLLVELGITPSEIKKELEKRKK